MVALADRIAYTAHDLEDATHAGIVDPAELPDEVVHRCGRSRSAQLRAFVTDVVQVSSRSGQVALSEPMGEALAVLRRFNYERIYLRPASAEQSRRVVDMLASLVEHYSAHPAEMPADHRLGGSAATSRSAEALREAVGYVAGMTDRFACVQAIARLGWTADRLPRGFDSG